MQFYDTPRNVKEVLQCQQQFNSSQPVSNGQANLAYGNYDFPQHAALPVYKKQCGCIMKLMNMNTGNNGGNKLIIN